MHTPDLIDKGCTAFCLQQPTSGDVWWSHKYAENAKNTALGGLARATALLQHRLAVHLQVAVQLRSLLADSRCTEGSVGRV